MTEQHDKTGAPPGTVIYLGEAQTNRVKITLIEYNETEFIEKDFYDWSECVKLVKPDMVRWINVDGIHEATLVEAIGKHFNIHPLTLEDVVNTGQRPKFEDYENYVVSIMKMINYNDELSSEQLSVILMEGTVLSFQEADGGDANPETLKSKREETMNAYYELRKFLEAYATIQNTPEYIKTISELNALIDQYNQLLNSRIKEAVNPPAAN